MIIRADRKPWFQLGPEWPVEQVEGQEGQGEDDNEGGVDVGELVAVPVPSLWRSKYNVSITKWPRVLTNLSCIFVKQKKGKTSCTVYCVTFSY